MRGGGSMPKITDGQYALGALTVFAVWVFVVLPFLYDVPIAHKYYGDQTKTAAQYTSRADNQAGTSETAPAQVLSKHDAATHPNNETDQDRSELWSAKLTDWLLAAFTLALVFFTRQLYVATAGMWEATKGLRDFAEEQSRDMKASVAVAQRAAEAAELSAKAAIGLNCQSLSLPTSLLWRVVPAE
jgi:hypothetical protein